MNVQRIYFMQHGLAVDKAIDPERPLSETGIDQTEAIAEALLNSRSTLASIFHSGKLRASQTADIIASRLNISSVTGIDGLSPNDDVTLLTRGLSSDNALYVGHLPHLEKLITQLVNGNPDHNVLTFQNSAIACLDKNDDGYHLCWYLTPGLLGRD